MAYAAITSLMGTLSQHFLQPQPRLPLQYKQQILSLHQNLGFLQQILEEPEISTYDNSAMKDLEAQMRDVAFKAEERIEMELTTIYLEAKGWMKRVACLLRLHGIFIQAVIQTDYLKKKLIKISEKQLAKGPSQELFEHWNMQSFIVHGLDATLDSFEASGIWKMPILRNLCLKRIVSLGTLSVLEKLNIKRWRRKIRLPCSGIPWATGFLPNLKKLKFSMTNLAWSDMKLIGMLPNLEVLKLKDAIFSQDRMWEASEEGFRQLKRLVIEEQYLERWNAEGENFPVLKHLEFRWCSRLQEIPIGFAGIITLELIQLNWCRDSVLASAKSIQEELWNNYGKALLVRAENMY
nr:putative late blight resistance protein homolog R1A-4 [Ipomoea batatas]